MWIIWRGTSEQKLFSTSNMILVGLLVVLQVATTSFSLLFSQVLLPKHAVHMSRKYYLLQNDVLNLMIICFLGQCVILLTFLYYGFKGGLDYDSNLIK